MGILDKVVKIEKSIEKLAVRKDVPATPIEIRRAILDDIEEQVRPAGRSRKVFPYDLLAIEVVGAAADRAALEAVLNPEEELVEAIRERLHEAGCDRVGRLQVTVKVVRKARADWKPDSAFQVTYERTRGAEPACPEPSRRAPPKRPGATSAPAAEGSKTHPAAEAASAEPRQAQLVVLEGDATKKAYTLGAERTNIGRLAEVTDRHRRVVRRNQVVFLDIDSDVSQTVSRAQAHIQFAPPAGYRLYDDRSSYGTRILREGRMIELPSGSPRGVKLRAGDEIYFGRARVVFRM